MTMAFPAPVGIAMMVGGIAVAPAVRNGPGLTPVVRQDLGNHRKAGREDRCCDFRRVAQRLRPVVDTPPIFYIW
jgi:hypothetical protein